MTEVVETTAGTLSDQLRQAASQGQFSLVSDLVKNGAQFSSDQEGRTALHYAALNGHAEICKFLLQQGCSMNEKDVLGYTPLHRAASKGHTEAIDLLLKAKCDVDSQDEHGNGAIHESAWNGFSQTLELLIKHNCNVILTNKSGFTALHLASQNGHNQSARVLLYAGCNADLKNNYGDTALHTAARYGHAGVTRILISARCRLNEQNKNGDTALHISAALKRKKIAKLLVEAGIDINIINKQEETAIDVARRKDHPEVIMTITSLIKTKVQVHPSPKAVNFTEIPVDMDGPVVVPDEDIPMKTEKSGSKLLSFFKKKKKEKEKQATTGSQVHPSSGRQPVQGFFSQYVPKQGQQYYRDLAGNIKQGPVGYTPICQCMPALQQLEKRVDKDKEHIYEHIDASHQILKNRMDQLDRKTNMQMDAFDRWSRDRFDDEERNCYRRIDQRLEDHATYRGRGVNVDDWLESKLSEYGHCLDHHHDDTALPNNNIFMDIHQTENGRLFRSRSDETLSQSDNHSGRFRKRQFYESRQQAMQQIRAWQLPSYGNDRINRNPVVGRRFHNSVQQNSSPQPGGQNFLSPITSPENRPSHTNFISTSTSSTARSPYLSHDQIYSSQYDHGAIPKKLPTSQTWHDASDLRAAVNDTNVHHYSSVYGQRSTMLRDSSPLNHSTPHSKSRESSPYDFMQQRLKNRTDPERTSSKQTDRTIEYDSKNTKSGIRPIQTDSRLNQAGNIGNRQYHCSETVLNEANLNGVHFNRQNDTRHSHIESRNLNNEIRNSDTRRSFPERGSSNTSTGTNLTSNSSSTGQGPLTESSAGKRPTFTTFGYPERNNTHTEALQRDESKQEQAQDSSKVSLNTSVHQSINCNDGDLPTNSSHSVVKPQEDRNPTAEGRLSVPIEKTGSQGENYLSKPKSISAMENRDDMYFIQGQNGQMNRRRSRSSDGILLEDDLTSAYQMSQKAQNLSSSQQLVFPNSHGRHTYNVQRETLKQTNPVYGSSSSYHNDQRLIQSSRVSSNMPNGPRGGEQVHRPYQSDKTDHSQRQYPNEYGLRQYANSPVNRSVNNSQYHSALSVNRGHYQGQETLRQQYIEARDIHSSRMYSVQDKQSGKLYNQGNRDRPILANDSSARESHYGRSNGVPTSGRYNVYNPNFQGSSASMYNNHSNMQRVSNKTESNQNSHESFTGADRNLQSTPIQDKSREDNSSNPDSGYSSKIFGGNTKSGNMPSTSCTPSSSFSTEPTDHNITLSSNNSPHPKVNSADYDQISSVGKRQYQKDLTEHVQQWYQRKLKDAAKNLNETDYGYHGDIQHPKYTPKDGYSGYDIVQPSKQPHYHANQRFHNYQQMPNYIHGSDV